MFFVVGINRRQNYIDEYVKIYKHKSDEENGIGTV